MNKIMTQESEREKKSFLFFILHDMIKNIAFLFSFSFRLVTVFPPELMTSFIQWLILG